MGWRGVWINRWTRGPSDSVVTLLFPCLLNWIKRKNALSFLAREVTCWFILCAQVLCLNNQCRAFCASNHLFKALRWVWRRLLRRISPFPSRLPFYLADHFLRPRIPFFCRAISDYRFCRYLYSQNCRARQWRYSVCSRNIPQPCLDHLQINMARWPKTGKCGGKMY